MPKPRVLFANLVLFILVLLVSKLRHIGHTLDQKIIVVVIFTLRIWILRNEVIVIVFNHLVIVITLVLIVVIILVLEWSFATLGGFGSF